MATELEVSTKSVYRDLEFMRDRLQLPLEFDRAHAIRTLIDEVVHRCHDR